MKKICFVTTTSITLKIFVVETAIMLHDKLNVDVTFVCNEDKLFSESLPSFIHYIPIPMKRGINLNGIESIIKLHRLFKNEKYDIVQYSTPNASFYASIASRLAKNHLRLYCQWGIRFVGFNGIKRKVFKLVERIICNNSTDIRAVSFLNLEFAIKEKLYTREAVKVLGVGGTIGVCLDDYDIHNSENYKTIIRKKYHINDSFVYGFVGRFSKDKGANEILKAFRLLSENRDVILLCVGPIEINEDIDNDLYRWAQKSSKVIFVGPVENAEIKKYFASMDCFVHPSYREGFGMVLQESAAMACPIITTRIPGASEVMVENVSCILVDPKNVNSLYRGMEELYFDREKARKIGIEARIRVETFFDRKIMIENQRKDYIMLFLK